MTISLLTPTRNRPQNVYRLIESALNTAEGSLEFIFYVDDDAPNSIPINIPSDHPVVVVKGPRIVLSECWNRCYEAATADILMHCGDDIIFETPGWDRIVVNAFNAYSDRIVFVHGLDSDTNYGKFGTHGFLHRRWVETVGHFVPPYFASDWNDVWLNDVANSIGRRQYVEIMTRHMHPCIGLAEWDQTHLDRLERDAYEDCNAIYVRTNLERETDIQKLRAVMS